MNDRGRMPATARAALLTALIAIPVMPLSAHADAAGELTLDPAQRARVASWLDANLSTLLPLYRHLHANPELSLEEVQTAALVAKELRAAGYEVTTGVGGHGVVGVLRNGAGRTLLIRGDMDGLPVTEATGLDHASQAVSKRPDGTTVGVMHACGHDVHVANLIGTARLLAAERDAWTGTLVVLAQPAEELGEGARRMIADGLFERFPQPDVTLALHVDSELAVGQLGVTPGWTAANVDAADITLYGRGGHGARPHQAVDPILAAAHLVVALQSLVSRRVDPAAPAVVTVGSIHGGSKHNVIPDDVHLQLTVRSYSEAVRKQLLDGIRQIAADTCRTFECPRAPKITVRDDPTPAVYNDLALSASAISLFGELVGEDGVIQKPPGMGGEDFGRYARTIGVPGLLYRLGSVPRERYEAARRPGGPPLPSLHSSRYAPDAEPTLRNGVQSMSALAIAILQ